MEKKLHFSCILGSIRRKIGLRRVASNSLYNDEMQYQCNWGCLHVILIGFVYKKEEKSNLFVLSSSFQFSRFYTKWNFFFLFLVFTTQSVQTLNFLSCPKRNFPFYNFLFLYLRTLSHSLFASFLYSSLNLKTL